MRKRSFLWQIFPPVLLIVALSLLAGGIFASSTLERFYLDRTRIDLEARAVLLGESVPEILDPHRLASLRETVNALGQRTSTRYTVTTIDGRVIADSDADPDTMDDHSTRPEIHAALSGAVGSSLRYSQTISADLMYVALPIRPRGDSQRILVVVRAAVPLTAIDRPLAAIYRRTAIAGVAIIALAGVVVLWLSRRISRPLVQLRDTAELFAAGELTARPPQFKSEEISELSVSMVRMAKQLEDRINAMMRHTGEQERVLSSMIEGVLAVDSEGRLTTLNQAAARALSIGAGPEMLGRGIEEVVRTPEVLRFIARVRDAGTAQDLELQLPGLNARMLHLRGAPIVTPTAQQLGVVVVIDDVTQIERLESVRKDFVANVSHELKTPITSIKASVETMLDGAVDDEATARRFLEIIARQSDRLATIVDDLLSLSRIEQEAEGDGAALEPGLVGDVVVAAVDACRVAADRRSVRIKMEVAPDLRMPLNTTMLEQAFVNLIDNAVKYSEAGEIVTVTANRHGDCIRVQVRDNGCGIDEPHLARLFERFYRVDKARSRSLGGTGLGLAITKHAVQAHGGSVSVESKIGIGSTFSIDLPLS